jgi:CDP-diacylglycerol--serine O-phosphatidyltransferase
MRNLDWTAAGFPQTALTPSPLRPPEAVAVLQYASVASAVSTVSLSAGFLSLHASTQGHTVLAVSLVLCAALCDAVDGPIARARGSASAFGANLDSLADLIAFGVAPALALAHGPLRALSLFGMAVATVFVAATAWRLARFPLCRSTTAFVGCPAPLAALLVVPLVVVGAPAAITAGVVVLVAVLMTGTVPVPKLAHVLRTAKAAGPRTRGAA